MTDQPEPKFTKTGEWIIRTSWRESGDPAWWGRKWPMSALEEGLVNTRGAALRYDDFATVHEYAHMLKESGQINRYTIEPVMVPIIRKGNEGSSGRA